MKKILLITFGILLFASCDNSTIIKDDIDWENESLSKEELIRLSDIDTTKYTMYVNNEHEIYLFDKHKRVTKILNHTGSNDNVISYLMALIILLWFCVVFFIVKYVE